MRTESEARFIQTVERYGRPCLMPAAECEEALAASADRNKTRLNIGLSTLDDICDTATQPIPRPFAILHGLYAAVRMPDECRPAHVGAWLSASDLNEVVDGIGCNAVDAVIRHTSRPDSTHGSYPEAVYATLVGGVDTNPHAAILAALVWMHHKGKGDDYTADSLFDWIPGLVAAYALTGICRRPK